MWWFPEIKSRGLMILLLILWIKHFVLKLFFHISLQQTYEAKRQEFLGELQRREEEMRQTFVQRVKEKEAELKDAEREVRLSWLAIVALVVQSLTLWPFSCRGSSSSWSDCMRTRRASWRRSAGVWRRRWAPSTNAKPPRSSCRRSPSTPAPTTRRTKIARSELEFDQSAVSLIIKQWFRFDKLAKVFLQCGISGMRSQTSCSSSFSSGFMWRRRRDQTPS